MKQPIKMTPGDELHLTALMAPFSLNLVTGQDRQHLLGYGRAAFEAGQAGQCLHQIQEPAAAEQAAWHAGLDEGRAQAAPAAVAVPEDWMEHLGFELDAEADGIWQVIEDTGERREATLTERVLWKELISIRAALAATPAAAAPVVLPEPDRIAANLMRFVGLDKDTARKCQEVVRCALLAGVSAPAAQAINLLAADHSGMKVDYRGLFSQVQRAIKRSDPGYAEMLRQLEGHLQELGQRWYAGDTNVVDEILQLYCIERDARKTVRHHAAAAPQAQADARDPEITWPKARDVGRIGDMSQVAHIRVGFDSDNDVLVSVWDEKGGGSIEFCNPGGGGGGQSSRTRMALIALMVAMEADNAEKPSRDWWAQRAAIAAAKGEGQ
ncbi:hypothetical protein COAQ111491_16395 [Comamonas aquatilis]|uniref:hypothetical protein n=1 Tax=Comamonas aquatilis TaxID=1778406 RepID=UPI0039EEC70A